jgi:hypothetical protein
VATPTRGKKRAVSTKARVETAIDGVTVTSSGCHSVALPSARCRHRLRRPQLGPARRGSLGTAVLNRVAAATTETLLPGRPGLLRNIAAWRRRMPCHPSRQSRSGPLVLEGNFPSFEQVDALHSPRGRALDAILVEAARTATSPTRSLSAWRIALDAAAAANSSAQLILHPCTLNGGRGVGSIVQC